MVNNLHKFTMIGVDQHIVYSSLYIALLIKLHVTSYQLIS